MISLLFKNTFKLFYNICYRIVQVQFETLDRGYKTCSFLQVQIDLFTFEHFIVSGQYNLIKHAITQ
jgi:hypothetical protein